MGAIILAGAALWVKTVLFVIQNPYFLSYWDWPGHLQRARTLSWIPWVSTWDTTFWGGYPAARYPWLYHYLLKMALGLPFSPEAGVTILSLVIISLFAGGCVAATRRFLRTRAPFHTVVVVLGMFLVFLYTPGSLLGSFRGTLFAGGAPALLATALLLFFFAAKSARTRALLAGLILLTHPLTASVVLMTFLIELLVGLINRDGVAIRNTALSLIVSLIIGLPWILVMLDRSFESVALSLSGEFQGSSALVAVVMVLVHLRTRNRWSPLVLITLALFILSSMPEAGSHLLQQMGIRGVHFYRYQWYFLLLSPLAIGEAVSRRIFSRTQSVVLSGVLVVAFLVSPQPALPVSLRWEKSRLPDGVARVMDVSRHSTTFHVPHAAEHWITGNSGLVGASGVFFESSPLGLEYYALKNVIDPGSRKSGTNQAWFNDPLGNPKLPLDIAGTARLLGVQYVSFTTTQPLPTNENVAAIGQISLREQFSDYSATVVLERIEDAPLVESLSTMPILDPTIDLGKWWTETDRSTLVVRARQFDGLVIDRSSPAPVEVTELDISPATISFVVPADAPVPLVVKFAYSPYWKVRATGGATSSLFWITPGYIFLVANGHITLSWQNPSSLSLFAPLGPFVALMCAIPLVGRARRFLRRT